MKRIPVLFKDKKECCGCTACYAVCPVKAIKMVADSEGFEYPIINKDKCIKCHKCVKICSFKKG